MNRLLMGAVVAVLIASAGAAGQQNPSALEKLFASAEHKATVTGDLTGAIEDYRRIVAMAGGNQVAAAQALLRIAGAYRTLGDSRAVQTYEQIVREFGSQSDVADAARARLREIRDGGPGGRASIDSTETAKLAGTGVGAEQLWDGGDIEGDPALSPDGVYLVWSSWSANGNLLLKDLRTGTVRPLTRDAELRTSERPTQTYSPVFSPDGKRVAYGWYTGERNALRIVDVETGRQRVVTEHPGVDLVFGWSPDARLIALNLYEAQQSRIALASVADGSVKPVKSTEWQKADVGGFSADGRFLVHSLGGEVFALAIDGSSETKLAEGEDPTWTPDGRAVVFVSNRSGEKDLWMVPVTNGRTAGAPALLKRKVPINHGFTRDGSLFYGIRGAGRDVFSVRIDPETGRSGEPSLLIDTFVGANGGASWSPDGAQVAFLRGLEGEPKQLMSRTVSSGEEQVLALASSAPRAQTFGTVWSSDGRSILLADRADGHERFMRVDVRTGAVDTIFAAAIGSIGAFRFAGDGRTLFYVDRSDMNAEESGVRRLVRRDVSSGRESEVLGLSRTGPWTVSPDGRFLAVVDEHRALAVLPVNGGPASEILPGPTELVPIAWSRDGRYIICEQRERFVERERDRLWAVPLEGGPPIDLGISAERIDAVSVSPEEDRLLYSVTRRYHELWLVRNVLRSGNE